MNIPMKYEDVVAQLEAALGREAALLEELRKWKETAWRHSQDRDEIQQRLTVAEQWERELVSALNSANSELKKMIPLMKSDESGNRPDCASLFQSIIDTQENLPASSVKKSGWTQPEYWPCRSQEEFDRFEKWKIEDDKASGERS